jgi:hypothetical protein
LTEIDMAALVTETIRLIRRDAERTRWTDQKSWSQATASQRRQHISRSDLWRQSQSKN